MELRSLRERLKMRVAAELDLTRDVEDAEIARMIDRCILEETKDQYVPLKERSVCGWSCLTAFGGWMC